MTEELPIIDWVFEALEPLYYRHLGEYYTCLDDRRTLAAEFRKMQAETVQECARAIASALDVEPPEWAARPEQ